MMRSLALVIGCSEQLPNELRAYRLVGTSTDGAVLLSRHGTTYSAAASEVTAYPQLLERMLGLVLARFPPRFQERARPALIRRWNRDWGIEAEDLDQQYSAPANDNRAIRVTASFGASTSSRDATATRSRASVARHARSPGRKLTGDY